MKILKSMVITVTVFIVWSAAHAQTVKSTSQTYVMPRTEVLPIKNDVINAQYELYVKLPEDYEKNANKQYPVIYFTDAVWHIDILSAAAEYLFEEVILVGISWQIDIDETLKNKAGDHVSRHRDYTIKPSSKPKIQAKYQLGQAKQHLSFISEKVIKTVENNYRVDANKRTYFGYSTGGEFGTFILLTQPELFQNFIIGSPALKGDIAYLTELSQQKQIKDKNLNANVYIAYGSEESKNSPYIQQLIKLLKAHNDKSLALTHEVVEGSHKTAFPMISLRSVKWLAELEALNITKTLASSASAQ